MLNKNVLIALAIAGTAAAADAAAAETIGTLDPEVVSEISSIWPGYYGWQSSFASLYAKSDYSALESLVSNSGYQSYLSRVASLYSADTSIFTNTDSVYAFAGTDSFASETGLASATASGESGSITGDSATGSATETGSASASKSGSGSGSKSGSESGSAAASSGSGSHSSSHSGSSSGSASGSSSAGSSSTSSKASSSSGGADSVVYASSGMLMGALAVVLL